MSRPRVLVLTPDFPPTHGGIQLLISKAISGWDGVEVVVVTPAGADDRNFDESQSFEVRRVRFPSAGRGLEIGALNLHAVRAGLRLKPNAIICAHIVCSPAAAMLNQLRGTPVLQYLYAKEVDGRPRLARFATRRGDRIIVISDYTWQIAVRLGARADQLRDIPPGVDIPTERLAERAAVPTIVTVSRLRDGYKGHDVIIEALPWVRERVPSAPWVVGGGAEGAVQCGRLHGGRPGCSATRPIRSPSVDALTRLLIDERLASRLGAAGGESAREFEWSSISRRLQHEAQNVIDDSARAAGEEPARRCGRLPPHGWTPHRPTGRIERVRRIAIISTISRVSSHLQWRAKRVRESLGAASQVDERVRYLANELSTGRAVGEYTVGGRTFRLAHGTQDVQIFREIFTERFYDLPDDGRSVAGPMRVADLGGNIGVFALWAAVHWPGADVVAFEPDPGNAVKYRWFLERNDLPWRLVEACACAADGRVGFTVGQESESRLSDDGDSQVNSVDVFPFLAEVDIVKMDIEGGEWELLLDPRFAGLPARVVLMEYHPYLCPEADAGALATRLLVEAGYDVAEIFHAPQGHGMLRATRRAAAI